MMTFEEYLVTAPAIDHALRATVGMDGKVTFYIHPMDVNGQTMDFTVEGNTLIPTDNTLPTDQGSLPI